MHSVTTTNGKTFDAEQHVELARLIYLRWGEDIEAATVAWKRLFQNGTTSNDFHRLVHYPRHTENCDGWCDKCPNEGR